MQKATDLFGIVYKVSIKSSSYLVVVNYKWVLHNSNVAVGGFWDPQPTPAPKPLEPPKVVEPPKMMIKKKPVINIPVKKETSPAAEFELWCTTTLTSWSSKIDGNLKTFHFYTLFEPLDMTYIVLDLSLFQYPHLSVS